MGHRVGASTLVAAATVLFASGGCTPALLALAASEPGERAKAEAYRFERHEVATGVTERQTVLTGFFFGGAVADLAIVHIDRNGDRRLRVWAFDGASWVPRLATTLRPEVSFVDVATIGGRDRLVTYGGGRLSWFDPDSATERDLLAMTSGFDPPRRDEVPHVDITRDVNRDGRDDLVVPDADGFRIFVQTTTGGFADSVTIGPPTDLSGIYGADGYRYDPWSQSRIHEVDYDRDGRVDLVFWNEDRFAVHLQDETGRFVAETVSFTTEVAFDSDRMLSLAEGDMRGRVLHSLADLNGDGIADLVVFSLQGERIRRKRSAYEVHFGKPRPDGRIRFAPHVDRSFRSDGRIQLGMHRHDFDGDGNVDLMFTTIDLDSLEGSLWKRIKGFMGDDVRLELEFYFAEAGGYPEQPNTTRKIALDGVPSHREPGWVPLDVVLRGATHERRRTQRVWPRAFNSTLRVGDVTGDGRSDLIIGHHPRELEVVAGVPGPERFAPQPRTVKVDVPNDEEYVRLIDLDNDGKQDVVLHHPFTLRDGHGAPKRPPGTEPHRLKMLISRWEE